jgi:hypothetical protein
MAKFKREVIWCAEEKGNRKAVAIFGADESNVRLWQKHKTAISGCEASRREFTGTKRGQFPKIDDAIFMFFQERRKTGLFVSYELLRGEAINKKNKLLYCIVLTAHTAAPSFFQTPSLDHKSNPHVFAIRIYFFFLAL